MKKIYILLFPFYINCIRTNIKKCCNNFINNWKSKKKCFLHRSTELKSIFYISYCDNRCRNSTPILFSSLSYIFHFYLWFYKTYSQLSFLYLSIYLYKTSQLYEIVPVLLVTMAMTLVRDEGVLWYFVAFVHWLSLDLLLCLTEYGVFATMLLSLATTSTTLVCEEGGLCDCFCFLEHRIQ